MTVAGKGFFPLKADVIVGTSIVVTSTNNNAVKNITQELPARKKIGEEFGSVDYFADVMREVFRVQKVLDEDDQPLNTWGTIAAALGNAGNRRSFAQGFFRDEYMPSSQAQSDKQDADTDSLEDETDTLPQRDSRPPSMKQILEEASNQYQQNMENWRRAKQSFLELQAEFDSYRKVLELAEKAAQSIDAEQSLLDGVAAEAQVLDQDIQTRENTLSQLHEAQTNQRAIVEGKRAVLAQLRANTPRNLWDRLMGLFGHETKRMKVLRQSLDAPTHALAEASTTLAEMSKRVAEVVAELKRLRDRLKVVSSERAALERKLETHRQALQAGYATGAKHFPDAQFWCLSAETRHRASVAVSPRFDELRSKLFLQAVELHRLTVLANAGKDIENDGYELERRSRTFRGGATLIHSHTSKIQASLLMQLYRNIGGEDVIRSIDIKALNKAFRMYHAIRKEVPGMKGARWAPFDITDAWCLASELRCGDAMLEECGNCECTYFTSVNQRTCVECPFCVADKSKAA